MEAETSEPALDSPKQSEQLLTNGCDTDHEETFTMHSPILTTSEDSTIRGDEELQHDGKSVDESTSRLQERLDLMVREMDDMKVLMESYKHRAEGAERERKSLAEMIERIRADNSASSNVSNLSNPIESSDTSSTLDASVFSRPESSPGRRSRPSSSASSPSATLQPKPTDSPDSEDRIVNQDAMGLQQGLSTALQNQERQGGNNGDVTLQSAPYLSMVGVVLIGVGIMTWLNGWQKGDR